MKLTPGAVNDAERRLILEGQGESPVPAPLSWASTLGSRTLWFLTFMYFCSNAGWSIFITYVKPGDIPSPTNCQGNFIVCVPTLVK